jgi:hypothetical protein
MLPSIKYVSTPADSMAAEARLAEGQLRILKLTLNEIIVIIIIIIIIINFTKVS